MSNYPRLTIAGGNQFPAIATAIPSQYPVVELVDGQGNTITTLGNGPSDGTWITMTSLLNSWVAGTTTPQYMKDSRGTVFTRGNVTGGSPGTIAFLYPAGYKPITISYLDFTGGNGTHMGVDGNLFVDGANVQVDLHHVLFQTV